MRFYFVFSLIVGGLVPVVLYLIAGPWAMGCYGLVVLGLCMVAIAFPPRDNQTID